MPRLLDEPRTAARLIASSVVRGAQLHSSHGGLCVVDCRSGAVDWVLDWNSPDIDVEERGGDRGLRGIGIAGDSIYVLSSVALIRLDRNMRLLATYRNPYLSTAMNCRSAKAVLTSCRRALIRSSASTWRPSVSSPGSVCIWTMECCAPSDSTPSHLAGLQPRALCI